MGPAGDVVATSTEVGGAVIRYDWRAGTVPAVVFLPGWCCPRTDWDDVLASWPRGSAVAAVDLPGQGGSSSGGRAWSVAELAAVVVAVVQEQGWPQVVLIGHSMGAAVAVEAARELGARVQRVVCVDALTYDSFYARQDEASVRAALEPYEADLPAALRGLVQALFVDDRQPELVEQIATTMASVAPADALASLRALLEWDRDEALARCTAPVDVIAARAFLDPAVAERLSARVRITQVDLGGHFFLLEQPERTAAALRDVLAGAAPAAGLRPPRTG